MYANDLSTFYSALGQSEIFQSGQIIDFQVVNNGYGYFNVNIWLRENTAANYNTIDRIFRPLGIRNITQVVHGRMAVVLF